MQHICIIIYILYLFLAITRVPFRLAAISKMRAYPILKHHALTPHVYFTVCLSRTSTAHDRDQDLGRRVEHDLH